MPPRRRSTPTGSLTPENLESLAHALAEGKRATVYLIEPTPSLALPEGTSAKVVSIDGNTVTIRPKGVDDELPFEADELRITRNPPASPASPASPAKPSAAKPAASKPASRPAAKVAPRVASPTPSPSPTAPAPAAPAVVTPPPAPKPAARKARKGPDSVSVTIHAGVDNDWSVTVTHGARRPGKAQPVSPESVSRAVKELGDDSAVQAVEAVITHAREEASQRVAELRRQLEEAQSMLAALDGENP
ncbi:MAG: DUF6319 family protein [Rhodococcus sp. (in: high G+C Gram-positive bacteria)]